MDIKKNLARISELCVKHVPDPKDRQEYADTLKVLWSCYSARAKGGRAKSAAKTAAAKENIKKRWNKNNPIDET